MTLDELMEYLYELYEDNGHNGDMAVEISTYSCGATFAGPMQKSDWEIRDGVLTLVAESN